MRVYIMTDMEGVCGVLDCENWCRMGHSVHASKAQELLTLETNAAVEGFLEGGATEIMVADIHGVSSGINPALLHPKAKLAGKFTGKAYPWFMDCQTFDVAAWVGMHPKAGTPYGHICHTISHNVRDMSVNGISIGEFGMAVFFAGELNIRSIFASGCEAFTKEAQELVPGIETVAVKKGLQADPGNSLPGPTAYMKHDISAVHLAPEEARKRIRTGTKRALERAQKEDFGLVKLDPPFHSVTVYRSTETEGPKVLRKSHATSVIELFNSSGMVEYLDADPMKLLSKKKI